MHFILFLTCAVVLAAAGQLLLKLSTDSKIWALPEFPMLNVYFFAAACVYFASMLFYASALKGLPITIAYPSMSISLFFVAAFSHIIWKTPFGFLEILAMTLIAIGLGILGYSQSTAVNVYP